MSPSTAMIFSSVLLASFCTTLAIADVVLLPSYYDINNANSLTYFQHSSPEPDSLFSRRQVYTNATHPPTFDLSRYLADAKAGCASRISTLTKTVVDDTGLAACYNVPVFNMKNGVFEAELRMYNVSTPHKPWKGVRGSDITMSLQYTNATVQPTKFLNGLIPTMNLTGTARATLHTRRSSSNVTITAPDELKVYTYLGMLNPGVNASLLSMNALSKLLIPEITLMAKDPKTNNPMMTVLSIKDSSFIAGSFQRAPSSSSTTTVTDTPTSTKFVIPGRKIAVLPIGLIATGSWAVIFIGVVGAGTISRFMSSREFHRLIVLKKAQDEMN